MSGLFGSTTIKGTRITDFAQTSASVGTPIPFLYGRAPVNGNVIFAALPPKETRHVQRQGKGGVKQESFTYSTSYAIAFCRGPILGYWWIKRNGKVVYSQDPNAPVEDLAYAAKWAERVMMYNGTSSQLPNSTIESYKGSGRVSAFKGLSYIVVPNEDVTDGGGAIPSYEAVPIAAPSEVWITSRPYAQFAKDTVSTGARLSAVVLYDFLREGVGREERARPTFHPTGGQLFEVIPPKIHDSATAQFAPTGGELAPPPIGSNKDNEAIPSFAPTGGKLAPPPTGKAEADEVIPSFAPTGGVLATVVPSNAGENVLRKLTSFWELTESSGVRYDSKGANHLSVYGSVTTATGFRGGSKLAANFPGGNGSCLYKDNNTTLQVPADGANVIFGWYRRTATVANATLVSKWNAEAGYSVEYSVATTSTAFGGTYQKGGTYLGTTTPLPPDNQWNFFVVWVDPTDKKPRIQINNGAITTNANAMDPVNTSTSFALGGTGGPSYRGYFALTGQMQYCGWIKGAILTDAERAWLYNDGLGRDFAEIEAASPILAKALLHFDGADGSTTFTDESGRVWIASGTAQLDTDDKQFGTASLLLPGTSGNFIYTDSSSKLNLSTIDFTIEAFVRRAAATGAGIASRRGAIGASGWCFGIYPDGTLALRASIAGVWSDTRAASAAGAVPLDTWTHVALSRQGDVFRTFVNGILVGTQTTAGAIADLVEPLRIGTANSAGEWMLNGRLDEFRFKPGEAVYTSNFTPPAAPLTL